MANAVLLGSVIGGIYQLIFAVDKITQILIDTNIMIYYNYQLSAYKVSMTCGAIIDLLKLGYVMFLTHIAYKGVL